MANPIIYQRTIASGDADGTVEKGVRLQNGCFARQFGTSDWTRIRVGIRCRFYDINNSGLTSLAGTPKLSWGFCSGTAAIPGDRVWTNWFGGVTADGSWTTSGNCWYIYQSSTIANFTTYTGDNYTLTDLQNAVSQSTLDFNQPTYIPFLTSSASVFFYDIEKKSAENYIMTYFGRNNPSGDTEYISDAEFLSLLENPTPSKTNYIFTSYLAQPYTSWISSSTDTYPLNSVYVYWERTDPAFELIDLYVVRLA